MRKYSLFLALLIHAAVAHAKLAMPLVDLSTHVTNTAALIAIWSSSDVTMNAGTTLTAHFPSGWQLPATAINLPSCNCVFAKYGMTQSAWAFTTYEVTVTAGTQSGQDLSMILPASFAPGAFYVRIDDYAAFKNPTTAGLATITLTYNDGVNTVTTESKPITIGDGQAMPGQINGYVYTSASGVTYAVRGALIIADTDTSDTVINALPLWDLGPTAGTVTAKPTTSDRYSGVTGADGRFALKVPFNGSTVYHVAALYGTTGTAGTANSGKLNRSVIQSITVSSSSTTAVSITLTGFTTSSP